MLLLDSRSCEVMDVGLELGPSPTDLYMADAGRLKLKRARSPPRMASPPTMAHGPISPPCQDDVEKVNVQKKSGSSRSSSPAAGD